MLNRYSHTISTLWVIPVLLFSRHLTQVDKFLPLHQRKKILHEMRPPPVVFEMTPYSGMLSPGERVNVQIKFTPEDGVLANF